MRLYALYLQMTQVRRWLNLVARSVFCGFTLSASLLLSTSTAFQSGPCDQDEDGDGLKEAEKQWQEGVIFFVVEPFLSLSPWELAAMSSLAQWWPKWEGWVFGGLSWLCLKKRGVGLASSLRWWQDGDEFLVARGASGGSLRLLSGLSPPNALQAHTRRAKEPFPHPLTWLWTWKREGIRS